MWFTDLFEEHRKRTPQLAPGGPRFVMTKVIVVVGVFLLAYTYVGYQVPQKIGLPPDKKELDLTKIKTKADLVQIGQDIFYSKGQCALCHSIGEGAGRCPNLAGVGARLNREFIYETLTKPQAYVKLDFRVVEPVQYSARMPQINKAPIGLSPQELLTVIAFVQSNGGEVTVTPDELAMITEGHEMDPKIEPAGHIKEKEMDVPDDIAMLMK